MAGFSRRGRDLRMPAKPITAPVPITGHDDEETSMARPRKAQQVEEIHKPDPALAVKIYREDIKPAQGAVGEAAQEMSTAYKAIKRQAHIQPQAAKLAFKLDQMEESKRDDFLRCFRGLLNELRIYMPSDLVDAAQGNTAAGGEVIPTAQRRRPKLATVGGNDHPADDSDLAGIAVGEPTASFMLRLLALDEWLAPNEEDWVADKADAGRWTKESAEKIRADFDDPSEVELVDTSAANADAEQQEAAE